MTECEWIIPEEVKQDGYYWFCDSSDGVLIVKVVRMNLDWAKPEVQWCGSDDFDYLEDMSGRFMGPLEIPEPFWIK